MTHVSLFSGIGGIDRAGEWAGFRTIAQVERDPYCLRILEKHWPGVHRVSDIRDFPDRDYGPIILVSGGFPCQPFSAAGKRRGTADDRHLWPEMLRVIQAIKPTWVLAENVPGILAIESGMVFESVLADLEAEGYETWTGLIPVAGAGAPHYRYRIFIVAYARQRSRRKIRAESRENQQLSDIHNKRCGADVADTERAECQGSRGEAWRRGGESGCGDWWAVEPSVGRVASGIPHRVDRLRALGNAVVPQQVYPILKAIADVENSKEQQ